jgi:hypothetical protein
MFHTQKMHALRFDIGVMAWPRAVRTSVSIKRSIKGNEMHKKRAKTESIERERKPVLFSFLAPLSSGAHRHVFSFAFLGTVQFACGFQERQKQISTRAHQASQLN